MTNYQKAMLQISLWFLEEYTRLHYGQPYDWVARHIFETELSLVPRIHGPKS